ncbi:MAG: hypothetical protein EOO23_04405 [Comamonadaceae bacterium]|nr:MAG: hypothetical protein EOO23_04405 [Comamonadaceae bacterium]
MKDGVGIGLNLHDALLGAGVVGLWEFRIDLGLVLCDKAMSRLYGIDPADGAEGVPPDKLRESIEAADLPNAVASLTHAIQSGSEYRAKYRVTANGRTVWVRAHAKPRMVAGRTVSLSGINLLAASEDDHAHDKIVGCMFEVVSLCRQIDDDVSVYFAEMLLQHVGELAAIRQMGRARGTA